MRSSLAQYHGALVMCGGWILHWKDLPESDCRRVTVGNPSFKAPNPMRRFHDLKLIAKEEHVNLFIPYAQLASFDARFLLNEKIYFCGFIEKYTRGDGSCDYAIASITQNPIPRQIEKLRSQVNYARFNPSKETLILVEDVILKSIDDLFQEIDDLGDRLPTFCLSKGDMVDELTSIRNVALCIRNAMYSRQYRRRFEKKPKSTLDVLVAMYS